MAIHPMEQLLIAALERQREVTLDDLGGLFELVRNENSIITSPFVSHYISILLSGMDSLKGPDIQVAESFVLKCFKEIRDALIIQEALECIEAYHSSSEDFRKRFFEINLQEAGNKNKPAVTRAWSLEKALSLSLENPGQRYRLLSYLIEISIEDEPEYLRHVVKIIGIANSIWDDRNLVKLLEDLADKKVGADEVYYELGLSSLAAALDANSAAVAKSNFKQANIFFQQAIENRESRPDAEAFHAAISILISFEENSSSSKKYFQDNLKRLQQAVTIYSAWHVADTNIAWITARQTEMIGWYTLARKLEALSECLLEPSWLEPIVVIEQSLLSIYVASRTILKRSETGGVEALVRPKIEADLIQNKGQVYVLEKWLNQQTDAELGSIGKELIKAIALKKLEMGWGKESGVEAESYSISTPQLSNATSLIVNRILEDCISSQAEKLSPTLEKILEYSIREIEEVEDYGDKNVRQSFNILLFQTLRFLESRMNMTQRNNPRLKYLFEDNVFPKESELQTDYYEFMHGNIAAGDIRVEVSDISSGRVDIYFSFGSVRFVAEIKRDEKDCSFDALRNKYIGQAFEYQNTNVKLGFLLVLDWSQSSGTSQGIEENIKIEKIESYGLGNRSVRAVVVIRIPARRKVPSQIRLNSSKSSL